MRSHWSLVLFTLLVQSAVGSVWCAQAIVLWSGGPEVLRLPLHTLAALCLTLAGLAAATAHLGKPGESLHALGNLKSSWLSREVLSVSAFAGILAALSALSALGAAALSGWMLLIGSLAGAIALYTMTRVYRLRTVPAWNHAGTPLGFFGSALLLGGLLCTLVLRASAGPAAAASGAAGPHAAGLITLLVVGTGLLLKITAAGLPLPAASSPGPRKALPPFLQAGGAALLAASLLLVGGPVVPPVLLPLGALTLVGGEIIDRTRFYASYRRVGL